MALQLKHKNLGDLFSNLALEFGRLNGRSAAAPIQMDTFVYSMSNMLGRFIIDDVNIPITLTADTHANYFDTDYGIKLGYMPNGDVILLAKGGTNTNYEYVNFRLASNSTASVTVNNFNSDISTVGGKTSVIYGCTISGLSSRDKYKIEAATAISGTYDVVYLDLTITCISKRSSTEDINFSIEGIPFTCKNNMTWFDLMGSPFERNPEDIHVLGTDGLYVYYNHPTIDVDQVDGVYLTSLIQDGVDYKLIQSISTMSTRTGDNPLDENEEIEFWRTRFDVINQLEEEI